jgi:pimeloyl-ACP methyl ester carboxylesterase
MTLASKQTASAGFIALAAVLAACLSISKAAAQQPDEKTDAPTAKAKAEKALPRLQKLTLETKDGVTLHVEYRPGTPPQDGSGKDIVPVVLLHMSKGTGADWKPLAESLSRAGHAVIVPDLRGHGQSTQIKRGGRTGAIDQATMRKSDIEAMVTQLVIEKNNLGELNLRKLCLIGAEMGAAIAINWAALDWSWPPLATGPQGQDVNGLVLLTPVWGFKGMSIVNATKQQDVPASISTMIIVGSGDNANLREARRLHQIFQKFHDDFPKDTPRDVLLEKKDLFFVTPATSLQGTKMLGEKSLGVEANILEFIRYRLVNKKFEWARRERPLD